MRIGIITDSTCDLPEAILKRYHIHVVPLRITIGNKVFRDWEDIQPIALYQQMLGDKVMPRTSPPTVEDFYGMYQKLAKEYDVIISVYLSSKLSQTFAHAQQAVTELALEKRVVMIDSLYTNATVAEMLFSIARDIESGIRDVDSIVAELMRIRDNIINFYSPDSLKWLVAGGRLNPVRAAVGNLLNVRPYISIINGEVVNQGTLRRKQVLAGMVEKLEESFHDTAIRLTFCTAGLRPAIVQEFQQLCKKSSLHIANGRIQMIGSVIGSHLGPNSVGVTAYPESGLLFDIE